MTDATASAHRVAEIAVDDVAALAAGAAVFGTGGGGAVFSAQRLTEDAIRDNGPVPLVTVDRLSADDVVLVMCGIGAPTVGIEMLANEHQPELLLREAERQLGRPVTTIMPVEIGGANGVQPVAWASRLGLAVLDADAMGRAFPNIAMVSMNVAGLACEWTVLSDSVGNVSVLRTVDLGWLYRHLSALTVASGSLTIGALYPMAGADVPGAVIEGTLSRAIEVGRALHDAREPVVAMAAALEATVLITGKIVDLDRRTQGGLSIGTVAIGGTGADRGRQVRVELQNEFLVAFEHGIPLVTVPDLISIVDAETGQAISTEMLRFGQRIAVLAWPSDPLWHTERGLELTGPAAFGYGFAPVPAPRGER